MSFTPIRSSSRRGHADAASQMYELGVDSALVVTDGSLPGILTDRNLVRAAANRLNAAEALSRVWMTAELITAPPSMTSPQPTC